MKIRVREATWVLPSWASRSWCPQKPGSGSCRRRQWLRSSCPHPQWKWGALAPWTILPRGHSYPGHRNCHQSSTAAEKGRKKGVNSWSHQVFSHLGNIHPLHNTPVIYAGWQKSGKAGERGGKKKICPKLHDELQAEGEVETWFFWMTAQQDTLH